MGGGKAPAGEVKIGALVERVFRSGSESIN